MQQENRGRVCFAGRAVKHLHAIHFDPMDGCRRAEPGIVLARRCAFHACSRRCITHEVLSSLLWSLGQVGYQRRSVHSKREHSMEIIVAVEVRKETARKVANRTRQISDGFLSVTGFRRIDCHWQVVCYNGLETQSSLAAAPT